VVCDLTRRETLTIFERYAQQMRTLNPQTSLVLIGNKADLVADRAISDADLHAVCTMLGSDRFFLSSAKTGAQVDEAFLYLADLIEPKT
jgi:hypothetical protein